MVRRTRRRQYRTVEADVFDSESCDCPCETGQIVTCVVFVLCLLLYCTGQDFTDGPWKDSFRRTPPQSVFKPGPEDGSEFECPHMFTAGGAGRPPLTPEGGEYRLTTIPSCVNKPPYDLHAETGDLGSTMRQLTSAFYRIGVPVFLIDGMLLGAVRNCTLNQNDHDVDLAVFAEDLFKVHPSVVRDLLVPEFCPFRKQIKKNVDGVAVAQPYAPYCGTQNDQFESKNSYNGWGCGAKGDRMSARPYFMYCEAPKHKLDIHVVYRNPVVTRSGFQENAAHWRRNGWNVLFLHAVDFELAWTPFAGTQVLIPHGPIETVEWLFGNTWQKSVGYNEYWKVLKQYPPMGTNRWWRNGPRSKHAEAHGWHATAVAAHEVVDGYRASFCWEKARKAWLTKGTERGKLDLMCAFEGDMCSCPGGKIKYGTAENGGIWSSPLEQDEIRCTASAFSHVPVAAALRKVCVCVEPVLDAQFKALWPPSAVRNASRFMQRRANFSNRRRHKIK